MLIKEQSVQGVILNDLSLLDDRTPLHPNVSHYFPIHGALTGKDWNIVGIRRGEDHTAAGASCPIQKNAAADVSGILRSGIACKECAPGYIRLITGNSLSPETGVLIHIGVSCGDGILVNPAIIPRCGGQIALTLYETAQVSVFHLRANIPQGTDTAEKGIFFMADVGDFIFAVCRSATPPKILDYRSWLGFRFFFCSDDFLGQNHPLIIERFVSLDLLFS